MVAAKERAVADDDLLRPQVLYKLPESMEEVFLWSINLLFG